MSDEAVRRRIGRNDGPVEDELERSFDAVVTEGSERLHRTGRAILITGLFGGIEVSVGIMAMLAAAIFLQASRETGRRVKPLAAEPEKSAQNVE